MASVHQSTLTGRQIQAALRRGVKDTLVSSGIQPATRRGNKELTLAVQRLAQHSYSTLDEATQAGQALGQKIAERSQAKGTTDLDGGIIRQLLLTGEIPTVAKVKAKPAKTAAVSEPQTKAPVAAIPEVVEPAMAEVIAEATEAEPADLEPTDLEPTDLEPADAAPTVAELETPEAGETVDAAIADAPGLDAMETLDPAAIEAPDSEPITAADTEAAAAVESA